MTNRDLQELLMLRAYLESPRARHDLSAYERNKIVKQVECELQKGTDESNIQNLSL